MRTKECGGDQDKTAEDKIVVIYLKGCWMIDTHHLRQDRNKDNNTESELVVR